MRKNTKQSVQSMELPFPPEGVVILPGGMVEMALQLGGVIRWVSDASEPAEGEGRSQDANRKGE